MYEAFVRDRISQRRGVDAVPGYSLKPPFLIASDPLGYTRARAYLQTTPYICSFQFSEFPPPRGRRP
jgi:hypothetical protein